MGIVSGTAVFIMLWWLIIFFTLPFGVQRNDGSVTGSDAGAPQNHRMKQKAIITTILTIIVWGIIYWVVDSGMISFREIASHMEPPQ